MLKCLFISKAVALVKMGNGKIGRRIADSVSAEGICISFPCSCVINGKLRWITTYIARFDPEDVWPTDLSFRVIINPRRSRTDRRCWEPRLWWL